ncbi:LysE family translocator [Rudanella paleaurantiibacter]|uniref:LysE family translocator n=1 Tax=Rudanella paleaurantiibacter TaxID=2614655 RepID=A0A7J5TYH4_9BACT|nr:LysE family transporter [Rudanella paleaurantiibacter]KAB7730188.1 LysE family translocator [Rudanella paleaurantiibacter]
MIEALFYGLLTGFLLCLTFGTVFFSLLQNSVDNGYRAGIKIAFGVVVCDMLFVASALFGTSYLPKIEGFDVLLTLIGVIFLVAIGLANLLKGTPRLAYPKTRFGNFLYYFWTGFLLNGLNPINFITWVTLAAYLRNSLHYTLDRQIAFMAMSLVGIFLTESALALSAHKLKRLFTPRVVLNFNRITGIVFLGIAANLAWTRLYQPLMNWVNW